MSRGIYKIINVVNNKFYVGSAVKFGKRKAEHKRRLRLGTHSNKHLQNAWNKYGETAFVFALVQAVADTDDLLAAENVWLSEHVGAEYCYNIAESATAFGLGKSGEKNPMWGRTFVHTDEAKAKIGFAGKGREVSAEARAKRSAKLKGRIISQEQREQISKTLTGEGNYWYGKKRPEHGAKVRKAVATYRDRVLVKTYASISELRAEFKATPTTVNRLLKSGKPAYGSVFQDLSVAYVDAPTPT
jgi:group I intron endonuclease